MYSRLDRRIVKNGMTKGNNSFLIGQWRVSPAQGMLSNGEVVVHLEPKAMQVLVYFASRPGEVVTREELERDVWQGALVGYDAVTNTIIKLRKALNDNARQPRFIATIPKKGYQLIAAISHTESESNIKAEDAEQDSNPGSGEAGSKTSIITPPASLWTKRNIALATLVIVIFFVLLLVWLSATSKNHLSTPSIAVLPFENLSDDPKQDYLADGITEDIITDLSRLSNMLVIASNTSVQYKGKNSSAQEVGKELNIKYVLRGTIRQLGDEVRVNTQLINTATGFNTWAQRYDRKITELFAVQDEVTESIVKALTVKISKQERQRILQRATDSLKAYDHFQEGQKLFYIRTTEAFAQAREAYKKAIEFDPYYGRAYGAMAVTLASDFVEAFPESRNIVLERALTLAKKAVELDDSTPQTYWALGFVYLMQNEFVNAEKAVNEAISIAPNYADGYGLLALLKMHSGEPARAIEINNKAMRLNPYYTWQYLYTHGASYYMTGNISAAITTLEEASTRNQNVLTVKLYLAASYSRAGRQNDAEWIINEIQVLIPNITLSDIEKSSGLANPKIKQAFLKDLSNAGLAE